METTSTPKNFFLQAGIIVTLYASIISFLTFLFNFINQAFPVESMYYYADGYSSGMRFAISTLIVMFPLYIYLSRLYRKLVVVEPQLKESKLRKWLLYFTLFIAGITIAVDLIVLINSFLQGSDITTAFILKVLSVFVVAAAVFGFYLKDIKGYWDTHAKQAKYIAYGVVAVVLISVVSGFFVIGSPAEQQKVNRDSIRTSDLQSIQWQIVSYYQQKGVLPATLEEVNDPISSYMTPVDPDTGEAYVYTKNGDLTFTLCATFETVGNGNNAYPKEYSMTYPADIGGSNWTHEEGETCFNRTIDPERYPVTKGLR